MPLTPSLVVFYRDYFLLCPYQDNNEAYRAYGRGDRQGNLRRPITKVNCRIIDLDAKNALSKLPIKVSSFGPNTPFLFRETGNEIAVLKKAA